jgi:regulator of protease activity HflC (stomatin/prohibitin superfamily)
MSTEKKGHSISGWVMLFTVIVMYVLSVIFFINSIMTFSSYDDLGLAYPVVAIVGMVAFVVLAGVASILTGGFFTLQPGQARVCVLFGKYEGTVRSEGLRWANPFYSKNLGGALASTGSLAPSVKWGPSSRSSRADASKISVRARTLNGEHLKVNDKMGNPIEIANVVVWHVADTAKAVFDVDDYEQFVDMQAETALRHVASTYAYDHMEDASDNTSTITLRSNIEEVSDALKAELGARLAAAGVAVDDARLTHLAYSPEIAQAMLRRQQAEAIIAARKKIVEGAVSMVDMAIEQLSSKGTIELDEDKKAAMASNLMVILCGESDAKPVVNTGTLYQG